MQLSKIKIKNYRLLIDAELEVDPRTTLIVGRNNTAKTSCFSCIGKVLDGETVSFDDYPLLRREDFYTKIALFMEKKLTYLYHDDVLKLFCLLLDNAKFRRVFADKYPLILIDEYQDSYKPIIDRFVDYFIAKGIGPQFGFFGDAWQTIYQSNKACGAIEHDNIDVIKKSSNFRSSPRIVQLLNDIRPDLPQKSAIDDFEGEVFVITCEDYTGPRRTDRNFKNELPPEELKSRLNKVTEKIKQETPADEELKVLMITHKVLATQQGCYKLDRVGRKTADLIRLMDFLEMYHVNLLICSNGINTASGLYKIFIQIFAVIAEFERDTLTERIVDNMMELAKDGRWLGGNTPMGFTVRRVTTGSGKGKSSYSYLESLPEEKRMVQRLYEIFRTTRSIQSTAKQMNEEGFHTPSGAAFNASTTRLVLRNPIYCTADKCSYDYFIDHDGNVFGDMIEFDGTHGLSAYNKTDQEKYEGSDSTFISPKYVQTIESKPVSEWIIAVGKHEGFIPSEQWIEVQELLDAIAEKYNRPHRKTNSLLAGLAHCPHCGRRLSVISESDRWTNGKPRFKYVCPGYRKKECNFKAVDGVLLDEFVVQQLSELSDENSERFRRILEIKIEEVLEQSQTVQEHNIIKKKRDKLKADIAAQTRNLREVDGSIKQFIQEDLQNLAEELRETERQLSKLDEGRKNNMIAIRDLEMTKEKLLSFAEYAKDAQPEVLVTLIQTIVERIYIVDKDDERYCHIFIKGCSGEDYTGFFQTAGYIEQKTTPVCDSEQHCICT